MVDKEKYMRRALQLAKNGLGYASPNPMVGAVIVAPDGRIIGEGWHRMYGNAHAEVNAVNSVSQSDRELLHSSTMYVTLEPCAHYGKTPPCALLIVDVGIPRVEVAMVDPFSKVSGKGIEILRNAGIEVNVGLLEDEARELNRRFLLAHTHKRPYITLKFARSADGFMDRHRTDINSGPYRFSNDITSLETMRWRSLHDAVLTTSATVLADDCRLTVRGWTGRQPRSVVLDRNKRLSGSERIFENNPNHLTEDVDIIDVVKKLYADYGITSVLVEAGPRMLSKFAELNLWDAAREEISDCLLGDDGIAKAPLLPASKCVMERDVDGNLMRYYVNDSAE